MNNRMSYETPEIEITRFEVYTKIMDDDKNDPIVTLPVDKPESIPDLLETTPGLLPPLPPLG